MALLSLLGLCLVGTHTSCALIPGGPTDAFSSMTWAASGEIFFMRGDYGVQEGLWVRKNDGTLKLLHEENTPFYSCDRAYVVDTFTHLADAIGVTVWCADGDPVEYAAYGLNVETYRVEPIRYADGLMRVLPLGDGGVGIERVLGKNGCQLLYELNGHEREPITINMGEEVIGRSNGSICHFPQIRHEIAYSPKSGQIAFSLKTEKDAPLSVALWKVDDNSPTVVLDGIDLVGHLAFSADGSFLYITSVTSSRGDSQSGIVRVNTMTGEYDWIIKSVDVDGLATAPEGDGLVYTIDGEFIFSE